MRVTAKLAYSQLKINRSRTVWSLAAIALSTALITAVCSFVASGNAMLASFMGSDYGAYAQNYGKLLLIPAILFGLIILTMSVVVISNVFRVSANERRAQFGILKCVGATGKQICTTVLYESVFLSLAGIPAGMALGLGLTFIGVKLTNVFLQDVNALADIMFNKIQLSLGFVLSWQALLLAALLSFLTVLCSALGPGRKAAKASAAESVKGTGNVRRPSAKMCTGALVQKVFGFEGTLASKNIRRNRQNFRATVIALTAGVVLFISLGALSQQAKKLEGILQPALDQTVIAEYFSGWAEQAGGAAGEGGSLYLNPIDERLGNLVAKKLKEYDGKDVFGLGLDLDNYHTVLPAEALSAEMRGVLADTEQDGYELPVELILLDVGHYEALCDKAGVATGSTILLNHYRYNDGGNLVNIVPYLPALQAASLRKADGSLQEVAIDGVLLLEDIPKELFYFNTNPLRLVVPQAEVRGFSWYSTPDDEAEFIRYANGVMAEVFPEGENAEYMENGFNTRVYKMDDYLKVMNLAIVLVTVFLYSFVALLMLIGFTNVVSTMSANVLMRTGEFAVLQSVGMTPGGLKRMLALESVLCSLKALVLGVPIGIALSYLLNLPIRALFPIPYELPWLSVLLCMLGVFGITWGTTLSAIHRLQGHNIIEAIRTQSGR